MRLKLLFVLCVAVIIMGGCTRTIYVPTETYSESHREAIDSTTIVKLDKLIDQLRTTSKTQERVVFRDSVIIMVNEEGKVVSRESFKSSDRDYSERELVERIVQKYDSLFYMQKALIDSLYDELNREPMIVEKPLSKWESFKMSIGNVVAIAILLLLVFFILRFAKKIL